MPNQADLHEQAIALLLETGRTNEARAQFARLEALHRRVGSVLSAEGRGLGQRLASN